MPRKKQHSRLAKWWRRYEYKHTTLATLSIVLFVLALDTAIVQSILHSIEGLGLLGIFIAGVMFTSFFTTLPAIALLVALSQDYTVLIVGLVGGAGSLVGDWIILKVFEERIAFELKPLIGKFHLDSIYRRLRRKKARENTMLLGMFTIMSPLPDEIGIALMGLSKFNIVTMFAIIYLLNSVGIMIVGVIAQA